MMTALERIANPAAVAAALAWHKAQPPGRLIGDRFRDLDAGDEWPLPEAGTAVEVIAGKRAGESGWMCHRKDAATGRIRTHDGRHISVHAQYISVVEGGERKPPPQRSPRVNRYGIRVGDRVEVIGGRHRGRFANFVKCAGVNQAILMLDDGTTIAPSAHFVRALSV